MKALEWPAEPPTLEGEGLRLRPWGPSDADAVFESCQDREIQRWTTVPVPYLRSDANGFVCAMAPGQWAARTGALFCVADVDDDRVLGSCGLVAVDEQNRVAEIGYWVAPAARNAGVARRAVELLAGWSFEAGGMHRLEIYVESTNVASLALAESVDCVREGLLRGKVLSRGGRADMWLFSLVRER